MPSLIKRALNRLLHGSGGGDVAPTAMPVNTLTPRVGEARMMDDVVWSESLIYASTNWPKYNPDSLIGRQGFSVYRRMMIDEQVKAVVRFKRDAITARDYYFEMEGIEEDESLQERIDLFKEIIRQMKGSFLDVLNGIMSAHYQGFSMSEIVIEPIEYQGKTWLGLKHIRVKPFESFFFNSDEFSNLLYVSQKWLGKEQEINMSKFIHHVQNPDIDPHYGQSELREAYRAWFSKDMAIRFQNIFLERSASGFIWITAKEGQSIPRKGTPEYNDLVAVISNMQVKTAIILPGQLELHYQAPATTDAFDTAITGYDRAIARSQLVPNLLGLTEHGKSGGYAQSQTQLEAFLWTLDAEAARLAETLNEQLFKPLGEQNWGDGVYPCFKFKPVSITMKLNIIKVWQSLITSGSVQHTDTDDAWLRDQLDVPEAGEPILPLAPQAPVGPDGKPIVTQQSDEQGDLAPGGKPKKKPVGDPAIYDETVRGRGSLKTSRYLTAAFTRAEKRVDFAVIDTKSTAIALDGIKRCSEVVKELVDGVKTAIKELDLIKNPDQIKELKPAGGALRRLRTAARRALEEGWVLGQQHAETEVKKAKGRQFAVSGGVTQAAAQKFLDARAYSLAGDTFEGIRKKAGVILYNAIKGDWSLGEIYQAIDDEVGSTYLPHLGTAIRTIVFEAINEARYDYFTDPAISGFVEALRYSAIIDGKTTEICTYMDGRTYAADSNVWSGYSPPLHFNCRSLLIPVIADDKWAEDDAPELLPAEGFGGL